MHMDMNVDELTRMGLTDSAARSLIDQLNTEIKNCQQAPDAWQIISKKLLNKTIPFPIHLYLFNLFFPNRLENPESAPAWIPTKTDIESSNLYRLMTEKNGSSVADFHDKSIANTAQFWKTMAHELGIVFQQKYDQVIDSNNNFESPEWFSGATLNIIDSCFKANPTQTALIFLDENKNIATFSYEKLNELSNQIANSLVEKGYQIGDAIGIAMPMNYYAVAIYLGIIKMGGVVVSIPDSFSTQEMATRIRISNAKAVFTQDETSWAGRKLALYPKVADIKNTLHRPLQIIVIPEHEETELIVIQDDIRWRDFLSNNKKFIAVACKPMTPINILFSSGTTADPKAIVWNHTTPIKVASDAYLHQNIKANDVLAWPTNLGWMMGPWLIFAALINNASIALFPDAPKDEAFGSFVEKAGVTMLGVVPTLVATWRQSHCMEKLNWDAIKLFSSTGECSNADDMLYLMSLANYKPVIEYCGGTEIGGAYVSSTILENNYPSLFTTPTMGMNIEIIDEQGHISTIGEVAIVPPSIGLSTTLLNANHHDIYFANMPLSQSGRPLRRHGDQIKRYANNTFSIQGRVDDSMNLGGIKVSAAEIERSLVGIPDINEIAAIAISPPGNGPSQLIIYAVSQATFDKMTLQKLMQKKINQKLNPLFKITDIVIVNDLPKTASNKIMRRELRKQYQATHVK